MNGRIGRFGVVAALLAHTAVRAGESQEARLTAALDRALLGHAQKNVVLSACVVDLSSGRTIYQRNADTPLIPASVMKLVVAAAALDRLGPGFRFETRLAVSERDLIVIGGGDPTFGDEKLSRAAGRSMTSVLEAWADALRAARIDRVPGRLLIDDTLFDDRFVHPNWPADQMQEWYAAPIGGLNFANNCVEVDVRPGGAGRAAQVSLVPPNEFVRLVNQVRAGPMQAVRVRRDGMSPRVVVSGTCAKAIRSGPVAVCDPGLFFAGVFRSVLARREIRIDGPTERARVAGPGGALPADLRLVATHAAPLTDAVRRACTDSQGVMAEGLIKTLGARLGKAGSWTAGAAVVSDFLQRVGASPGTVVIDDGSGLSKANRLSSAAVVAVLRAVDAGPVRDVFVASLARPGAEGTLKRRMRGSETRGRVYAKTGYVKGVRTLAGYVETRGGRRLAFAFLFNGAKTTAPLAAAQDDACRILTSWPQVAPLPAHPKTPVKRTTNR